MDDGGVEVKVQDATEGTKATGGTATIEGLSLTFTASGYKSSEEPPPDDDDMAGEEDA